MLRRGRVRRSIMGTMDRGDDYGMSDVTWDEMNTGWMEPQRTDLSSLPLRTEPTDYSPSTHREPIELFTFLTLCQHRLCSICETFYLYRLFTVCKFK